MINKIDKKLLVILGQTVFGLILLYVWFKYIDLGELLGYFPNIKIQFLLIALVFAFSGTVLRVVRWKIMLRPILDAPFFQLVLISFAGSFINFLVPFRIGEVSKSWFLKKKYNIAMSRSFPSILVDRGLDFIVLLTLFIVLPVIFFSLSDVHILSTSWALVFLMVPVFVIYILVWKEKVAYSFTLLLGKMLPGALGRKFGEIAVPILDGFSVLKRKPTLLIMLFLFSTVAVISDGVYFYFLFLAFGHEPAMIPILFATILMTLSFFIPSAPGYIGTTEVAGSLIFSVVLGIDTNLAASVVVFYHLFAAFMLLVVGLFALEVLHFNIIGLLRKSLSLGNNN